MDSLVTSKTRVKLLLKLFLNPDVSAHLRGLATEFGESSNAIRVELNRLTEAGMLESQKEGRTIAYKANKKHVFFPEINSIVRKYTGFDQIVDAVLNEMGDVELALITGDYARGVDSGLIDLVLVGDIDKNYLQFLVGKTEEKIERKIRTLTLTRREFEKLEEKLQDGPMLILWDSKSS